MADELLNVRLSLLQAAKTAEGPQLGDLVSSKIAGLISVERDCLTILGSLARARGDLSGAITALTRVQHLTRADANDHSTEFAEVLWLQGQHGLALEQLKRLLKTRNYLKPSKPQEFWLRANVLSLLVCFHVCMSTTYNGSNNNVSLQGQWTAEAKQATEIEIREDYFKPSQTAIYHAQKAMTPQQLAGVTLRYAQFADQQFQVMSQSEQIRKLKIHHARLSKDQEDSVAYYHRKGKDDHALMDNIRTIKQECLRNADQLQRHETDRLEFLCAALSMYAKVISSTDTHNNLVLRFCAIWLATESDDNTNLHIARSLKDIPSHKFVDLAYQLTARLQPNVEGSSRFHKNLYTLVTRICAEHPFHMAYQVLTLAAPMATKTSRRLSTNIGPRETAAYTLLTQVRTGSNRSAEIDQLERYTKVAISWAKEDNGKKGEDGRYVAAKSSAILTLKDMIIPVSTADLPVDPTMAYKGIPRLLGYETKYSIAGGIHHPKIMVCRSSDGRVHRELVRRVLAQMFHLLTTFYMKFKAGDDTRQDTIMEQLFKLANDLLDKDAETRRRKLHMRTYNVVTLAEETGIIQFVGQTMSLAEYLIGAHARYVDMGKAHQKSW
jgi:ataxia telangiectasia mutated family protein